MARGVPLRASVLTALVLATACASSSTAPTPAAPASPAPASPAPASTAPRSTPPDARDVFAAIGAHRAIVPTDPSCASVTGDPADVSLGAIEAHLLGQLAEAQAEGDPAVLLASCEAGGPPFRCALEVRIDADGDPWRYGIAFELAATGAIDPASIRCPGGA